MVLTRREVMQHKRASSAAKSSWSPWNREATEPSMWCKTAVRVLCKLLPRSPQIQSLLRHEDAVEIGAEAIGDAQLELGSKSDRMAEALEGKSKEEGSNEGDGKLFETNASATEAGV